MTNTTNLISCNSSPAVSTLETAPEEIHASLLTKIAAVARFALFILPACVLTGVFGFDAFKNEFRNLSKSFGIDDKKALAIVNEVTQRFLNKEDAWTLAKYAQEEADKMRGSLLGWHLHNFDAIARLDALAVNVLYLDSLFKIREKAVAAPAA